jgi:hypothetical protein
VLGDLATARKTKDATYPDERVTKHFVSWLHLHASNVVNGAGAGACAIQSWAPLIFATNGTSDASCQACNKIIQDVYAGKTVQLHCSRAHRFRSRRLTCVLEHVLQARTKPESTTTPTSTRRT